MDIDNGFVAAHLADITVIIAWPLSTINVCNVRKLNQSNFNPMADFDVMPDTSEIKIALYLCIKYYYLRLNPYIPGIMANICPKNSTCTTEPNRKQTNRKKSIINNSDF